MSALYVYCYYICLDNERLQKSNDLKTTIKPEQRLLDKQQCNCNNEVVLKSSYVLSADAVTDVTGAVNKICCFVRETQSCEGARTHKVKAVSYTHLVWMCVF